MYKRNTCFYNAEPSIVQTMYYKHFDISITGKKIIIIISTFKNITKFSPSSYSLPPPSSDKDHIIKIVK